MGQWLFKKCLMLGALFFCASALIFTAVKLVPGDPVALRLKNPDPEKVAALRHELGLDKSWPEQYFDYWIHFCKGEWGQSIVTGRAVRADVAERLPATLELTVCALGLGIPLGLLAGLLAHGFYFRHVKRVSQMIGAIGLTVPVFWLGIVFMLLGAVWLKGFPLTGRFDYTLSYEAITGFMVIDFILSRDASGLSVALNHLFLPALTLAFYPAALISGLLQARLNEPQLAVLLVALRAKGLSPLKVYGVHVLRYLGGPLVVAMGTSFGALLGGAVLTETVFAWPGMGRYMVAAVLDRDVFIIQYVLLLIILLIFIVMAVSDLIALLINPSIDKNEK